MKIKLKEIAELVSGKVIGNEEIEIDNLAKIEEAKSGDLTFLYLPAYDKYFSSTNASAILVRNGFNRTRDDIVYIEVADPNKAFFKVINHYFNPEFKLEGIDPTAYIHPTVKIGRNAAIGKNVVISAGCVLGNDVRIFHNTVIHDDVAVGDNCLLFSNVTIREKCIIGNRVIIHSGTVVGSDGFGYDPDENGVFHKIHQIGIVKVEDDVELGANMCIDRASTGATIIKKGVKIDNLVQVAHNVVIGENTAIAAQAGISGSTKIGKNCLVAGQVGVVGHIEITDRVTLLAQSGVSKGISKSGSYFGSPAKEVSTALKQEAHLRALPNYAAKIQTLENQVKKLEERLSNLEKS
ncbi:MAG: UDP-3-O-(3-hydroxymyristoyl)glucosamine N-acyltransferase [Ignavibacteriaceae bacterium]|nr:UDP-3-O-(3-hydroxymyristoyl)glucosamine N-acyltransferase [Ignavibacteriaceae bacterium]